MKVVEEAGGLAFMARLIQPVLVRLFPDVPPDHPAMGAMVMNVAANALGLGSSDSFWPQSDEGALGLNTQKNTATNAMVLFLAINTSGLALLPTGIIGLRALKGSADAAAIFPTTLLATAASTVVGISAAILLSRIPVFAKTSPAPAQPRERAPFNPLSLLPFGLAMMGLVGLVTVVYAFGEAASQWIMPVLIFGMLLIGVVRGVKVYEVFVAGAKEGFNLAVMIIPYLVAILSAVGMLRASGGLQRIVDWVSPLTQADGIPGDVLHRTASPLSGSGALDHRRVHWDTVRLLWVTLRP